ncbi:MAG: MSCRAMM family adhesin SdrC [Actinomycetota bacterium]|nr:MSCRAMM family adhesin SdrC [Actinomycetota bacterium]
MEDIKLWLKRAGVTVAVLAIAPAGVLIRTAGAWAHGASGATTSACTASSADTDRDGIPDCWEGPNGLVVGVRDAGTDKDHDGLKAKVEYTLDKATTADGLFAPYVANLDDSDGDGVEDGDEDLDGDGLTNEDEGESGTNALVSDSDHDGIGDAQDDTDGDGLTNETEAGSADEDGDTQGVDDVVDENGDGINDTNQDFDCDGVSNGAELNPRSADSDQDGESDALDDDDGDGIDNVDEQGFDDQGLDEGVLDEDANDDGVVDGDEDQDGDGQNEGDEDQDGPDDQGNCDSQDGQALTFHLTGGTFRIAVR